MGILDSLFGSKDQEPQQQPAPAQNAGAVSQNHPQNADEQALARYRYMLQTAPPEEIEKAHQEAFARLTPEQRQMALQQMSESIPENEARDLTDDPRSLARAATRAEVRQPGTLDRMFGNSGQMGGGMMGGGMMGGLGGMMAGSLLTSIAGSFIGSSIAHSFFSNPGMEQSFQNSPEGQSFDNSAPAADTTDYQDTGLSSNADPYGDPAAGTTDYQDTGLSSNADPYGDPAAQDTNLDSSADGLGDSGSFDDASFDSGGFDGGGFDGGDFGGDF